MSIIDIIAKHRIFGDELSAAEEIRKRFAGYEFNVSKYTHDFGIWADKQGEHCVPIAMHIPEKFLADAMAAVLNTLLVPNPDPAQLTP